MKKWIEEQKKKPDDMPEDIYRLIVLGAKESRLKCELEEVTEELESLKKKIRGGV